MHTLLLAFLLGTIGCERSTISLQSEQSMNTPPAPWTIGYHDGSGNGFRFWRSQDSTQYEYLPVTAQMSSSGIYDGGAAKQGHSTRRQPKACGTK